MTAQLNVFRQTYRRGRPMPYKRRELLVRHNLASAEVTVDVYLAATGEPLFCAITPVDQNTVSLPWMFPHYDAVIVMVTG